MSDREQVYSSIRKALQPLREREPERPRTALPQWEDELIVCKAYPNRPTLWEQFCERFAAVNGSPVEGWKPLVAELKQRQALRGYCDPQLLEALQDADPEGALQVETIFDATRPDDYAFGITRATGAIAESGTLAFNDRDTSSRLAALAPWVHVAVLTDAQIWATIPEAIQSFGDDPNIIWATGPSKTADVEGILIEGVHGPGVQIACRI